MAERDEHEMEDLFQEYLGKGKKREVRRPSPDDGPLPNHRKQVRGGKDRGIVGIPRKREAPRPEPAATEEEREPIWKRLEAKVGVAPGRSDKVQTGRHKLCPNCGTPLSEKNRIMSCTECGEISCQMCEDYERKHLASHIHYDYHFEFPLCMKCYERHYAVQKELGKARACFGAGNYTGAERHVGNALRLDKDSKYRERAERLLSKIMETREKFKEKVQFNRKE